MIPEPMTPTQRADEFLVFVVVFCGEAMAVSIVTSQ
jgi:hypothetical protein